MKAREDLQLSEEERERYWQNVKKSDKCWIWTGNITDYGIGKFLICRSDDKGKKVISQLSTHRIAWFLAYGFLDKHLFIKATCNNKKCVNPEHLVCVSQSESMALKKQGSLK